MIFKAWNACKVYKVSVNKVYLKKVKSHKNIELWGKCKRESPYLNDIDVVFVVHWSILSFQGRSVVYYVNWFWCMV